MNKQLFLYRQAQAFITNNKRTVSHHAQYDGWELWPPSEWHCQDLKEEWRKEMKERKAVCGQVLQEECSCLVKSSATLLQNWDTPEGKMAEQSPLSPSPLSEWASSKFLLVPATSSLVFYFPPKMNTLHKYSMKDISECSELVLQCILTISSWRTKFRSKFFENWQIRKCT